jgi:hypothetical protein
VSVNFFDTECSESPRTNERFGLCDDDNESPAYSDSANEDNWIATVENTGREVVFTPIDNCIIISKKETKEKESTCDGMLTFTDTLYLVELKNKRKDWFTEGLGQIENTIELMKLNGAITHKYLKAYVCNKKHPHFTTIDNAFSKEFKDRTGFRIDNQAKIKIR